MKNLNKWCLQYETELLIAVGDNPRDYGYPVTEVPAVVKRMRAAFERGSYNKDGQAIKKTCKYFGIKHTYKAINVFLAGSEK